MKEELIKLLLTFLVVFSSSLFVGGTIRAQNDAYFNEINIERDQYSKGFNFNDFSSQHNVGFNLGGFSGYGGNGFSFDDFANNEGDGFSFGNFNHTPDNVPLGSGLLLLTGFALLWRKRKAMRNEL